MARTSLSSLSCNFFFRSLVFFRLNLPSYCIRISFSKSRRPRTPFAPPTTARRTSSLHMQLQRAQEVQQVLDLPLRQSAELLHDSVGFRSWTRVGADGFQ